MADAGTQERTGPELIDAAARKGSNLTEIEQASATDWLLSDDPKVAPKDRVTLEINVGTEDEPRNIAWTVTSIGPDQLRRAQSQATGNRAVRRGGGEPDEYETHCWVVVEGSVDPDVRAASQKVGAPHPARFVRDRFNHKPGLVTQIAVEIMRLSGFDDSHVREVEAGKR